MAKYKVKVRVIAAVEYEVEIDSCGPRAESKAEDEATALWRVKTPEDFQVDKGYITDWETETEQLTADCPGCGVEHAVATAENSGMIAQGAKFVRDAGAAWWWEDDEYCARCGAAIEAAERATNS